MLKKIVLSLVMVAALIMLPGVAPCYATVDIPDPAVGSALLMDMDNGQVLFEKNGDERLHPASTTKIMTALLALEQGSLNDYVLISERAAQVGGTRVGLQPGERVKMEHLLHIMMLSSANDAAIAIAEHVGGTVEGFARQMNERAKQIGARDTNFVNPHGMSDENHYTTARDLALVTREAMRNERFPKIVQTINYKVDRKKYMEPQVLQRVEKLEQVYGPVQEDFFNQNKLLWHANYGYRGVTGVKTGYTSAAGMCLVASAERQGRSMLAVVLKCSGDMWIETARLLDYGFEGFTRVELVRPDEIITDAGVKFGAARAVLETADYLYYNFPVGQEMQTQRRVELKNNIEAPLETGGLIGDLVLEADGEDLGRVPLAVVYPVPRKISANWWFWAGLALLLLGAVQLWRRRQRRRKDSGRIRMDRVMRRY